MGAHNHIHRLAETGFASKMHIKAGLYGASKSFYYSLGYSFLKSSKDFIN